MNKHFVLPMLRRAVLALVLCSFSAIVQADDIAIRAGYGEETVSILDRRAQVFVKAYINMIKKEGLLPKDTGKGRILNSIRDEVNKATIAQMEYTYMKDGVEYTRTYYGRSGPAMRVVYDRASWHGTNGNTSSGSSTEEMSGSGSGSRPYNPSSADIARDAAEEKYYPSESGLVRAPNLPPDESMLQADPETHPVTNKIIPHSEDAELKIFRKIEADIKSGEVTRGGRLLGYVSKTVCGSCEGASRTFAKEFGIDGQIHQLMEPGQTKPATDELLEKSNEASESLKTSRRNFATKNLSPTSPWVTAEQEEVPAELDAIEAEEFGEAVAGGVCGDGV